MYCSLQSEVCFSIMHSSECFHYSEMIKTPVNSNYDVYISGSTEAEGDVMAMCKTSFMPAALILYY